MKARRNKKQVPSFRKLLKTSKVKLENKLKNKQFKQQSTLKKYRKEQRKLRQAVRDAVSKKPVPLEDPKEKRPGKRIEREEEEEEEALPLDMMDEDDLQLMKDLGQRASFLTRDLSSSEPIHAKKRKHERVIDKYEKIPRTLQTAPEKELIHLLPIKDKSGIIPQTREKPVIDSNQDEEDQEETEPEEEIIEEPIRELTLEEHLIERKKKLQEKKMHIAALASAIISDPESNIKKLKELRSMLMEQDPDVAVTVRKLVTVSLMELFKDITPSYKIRPLTEAEKSTKVMLDITTTQNKLKIRKETQKLREFEEGLVSQYKFYLENLEQMVKDWKQRKLKKSNVVSLKAYKGLAEVAVKSLCELLVALPHFNFHNNIIVLIVPLMNDVSKSMLKTFLCLRIKEVEVKKDTEDINKPKKFMTFKEKRKSLSRMQRKWKKAEEKLERELREAEASESTEKKLKLHTETLNIVFVTYFRILKKAQRSPLLPAVLEGLAKFAHLINVEFFDDLLVVLHSLIESGDLSYQESLHCVQTAFHILSGQGDVLNIDPMKFYTHLYKTLFKLHAGATNEGVEIVLQCLDVMLTKRRKQVSQQRALAFIKRLCTLALHVLPNSSIGILATNRILMHTFPKTDLLLDNESQGSGVFLPELEEPEYCNAQNTALWELHALRRHYHPIVQRFAAHLIAGAPSEGSEALKPELSRR
ncbi:Nucleolar complex protein 3-like protein [Camelus dromedarius]|uniref:Nucleolar complex protein 3 homolog n=1 Tax=Camelus dromedarius TaxID=9838 RepID=A0A5N4DK29_CAMDR|nr:Nucleolar complex protein 3-like protein [Camelus dromedarius]